MLRNEVDFIAGVNHLGAKLITTVVFANTVDPDETTYYTRDPENKMKIE